MKQPRTLFGRTALAIALVLLAFQVIAIGAMFYYVNYPLSRRATEDFAALMVLSAQTWVELPPATRAEFARELRTNHGLTILEAREPLPDSTSRLPYRYLLESALARRTGRPVAIKTTGDPEWFWADIPTPGRTIRVGFPRSRIGVQPPAAISVVLIAAALLTLLAALVLARRITRPLAKLAQAATQVGRGETPEPVPEDGPEELAALARTINRMAQEVRALLANRTTLLAGISHDLRTPLARMQLAIELLPRASDPGLVEGLRRDIEEMDRLIGQFLDLGRGLHHGDQAETDLCTVLDKIVADARRGGAEVRLATAEPCVRGVNVLALRRIVTNLVDNAVRYGEGKPVDVALATDADSVTIRVLDRGPGIPEEAREAVFQPFHRLEPSRSHATGGSGLGLAVARQLAQASGWRIELRPREGGGTEARLTLPAAG